MGLGLFHFVLYFVIFCYFLLFFVIFCYFLLFFVIFCCFLLFFVVVYCKEIMNQKGGLDTHTPT